MKKVLTRLKTKKEVIQFKNKRPLTIDYKFLFFNENDSNNDLDP